MSLAFSYSMDNMNIRPYQKTDYQSIKGILAEADMLDEVWDSEEHLTRKIETDPESILVAEEDGKIIGNVFIIRDHWTCFIYRLAVRGSARKKGVGSALLKAVETQLREQGVDEVALYVDSAKDDLKAYYAKRGYDEGKADYKCMWKRFQY